MILNACPVNPGPICMFYKTFDPTSCALVVPSRIPRLPSKVAFSRSRNTCKPPKIQISCFSKGLQPLCISSVSSPFLNGELGRGLSHMIPRLPTGCRLALTPRAAKGVPYSYRYPAMTKKPEWWWRTLACLPYLLPLHETFIYAETAFHLHHFLEDFEFLTHPFLRVIGRLPSLFFMAYCYAAYLGVVRRKEWPHYFRFHMIMGMLLESALQIMGYVCNWMPLSIYKGELGTYFWTGVALAYLFTVLESMRCALAGMYADIPFVSDAAYIHTSFD